MSLSLRGGAELAKISRELRTVGNGREIRKQLTRELRVAARPMVPAVRASIRAIPNSGGQSSGLRDRMAKATRLRVNTVGRNAGVAVLVDGKKMPAGQKALPSYMEGRNRRPWRHPVFGTDTWVTQKPHPYFYRVVVPMGWRGRAAVDRVLHDVTKKIT